MMRLAVVLLAVVGLANAAVAAPLTDADLDRRRKLLADLIDRQWEEHLRRNPEYASILGDKRYNDQSGDFSERKIREEATADAKLLRQFEAIDPSGFSDQERINRQLMIQDLRNSLEDVRLHEFQMPVTQMSGIHLFAAQLPSLLQFASARDYDDYVTRMKNFPGQMDAIIARMRKGMAERLMPPAFLLVKVADQAQGFVDLAPEKTPFAQPFSRFPAAVSADDQNRLRENGLAAIRTSMLPAYQRFAKFVREEYAPKGRTEVGLWSLPNGEERYKARIRHSTTTSLTADEIHEIGLREVARIEGEMTGIATKLGFADLASFQKAVATKPELRAKSREQILDLYRGYESQMYAQLPKLFGRLPKAKLEVQAIEPFREKTAAGADYQSGAIDGSRPGRINVNTYDATSRKTISMESTAYHEGVPGHHMQISIAQELTGLPKFRRNGGYTAFVEGWALYSERLGKEVGFYQDPWSDYGRLNDEMLRAIRLVVDTGLHAKKWSREQVVQFFHDHGSIDEVEVQSETDRYIVWPGQALGYKIGQLKITELRERARKESGDRFDLRGFHDEVLGAGALPLNVLEERIDRWIAMQKK